MTRKVRHPYQILEASEMAVGQRYAFIHAGKGSDFIYHYVLGGVIADSRSTAFGLGYDLDSVRKPHVRMFVAKTTEPVVTVHMDGWWYGGGPEDAPTLIYWGGSISPSWDELTTYLGPEERNGDYSHCIVVPSQRWEDDPRVHVTSWNNPDGVIERATLAESAAEWEHRMRVKTHAAMAKMLGF